MLYKHIIQELKYQRQRLNISTQALAQKIGVADSLVTKWECHSKIPNGTNLINWINALGFHVNLYQYKKAINKMERRLTLNTKQHSSSIITPQMVALKKTGMLALETGSEEVSNSETLEDKLKRATLSTIPQAFKKDANESLMLRVYEIRYLMGREDSFPIEKKIDKDVPNHKIGLDQYFQILLKYPAFLLKDCIDDIIKTFPYPRLPIPKEFIDRLEPPYKFHLGWLRELTRTFYRLEVFKQKAYINRTKED